MAFGFSSIAEEAFGAEPLTIGQAIAVTGVAAVGVVGTVDFNTDQNIDVTGVSAVGQVGTVDIEAG
jgi:hypothetical protein